MLDDARAKTESSGTSISTKIDKTSDQVNNSLEIVSKATSTYANEISKVSKDIDKLTDVQDEASESNLTFSERAMKAGNSLKDIGQKAQEAGEALSKLTSGLDFWETFEGFAEAEKAERGLNAVLKANGRDVEALMSVYKDFADEIENTTTVEGDLVIELLKQAEAYGVTGKAAQKAIKNAAALAEVKGTSIESAIRSTAALEQGIVTQELNKTFPVLRKIKDETERVAEAQRLLTNTFGLVEESARSTSGKITQLTNMWGNFKESVGEVISQGLHPIVTILQEVVRAFQSLPNWVQKGIAVLLTLLTVTATLATAIGGTIIAFTALTTTIGVYTTIATIATAASIALKTVLIAGVAYAAYQVGAAISEAADKLDDYNKALEESQKLNDKWADRFEKTTKKIMDDAEGIGDDLERKSFLAEQVRMAEKELQGYNSAVKSAEKEVEELNGRWARFVGDKILDQANKELDGHKSKLEQAKSRVEQLTNAYNKLKAPEADQELINEVKKFTREMELQGRIIGMTSDQAQLYKFILRGAKNEIIDAARAQVDLNRNLSDFNKLVDRSRDTVKTLADEIRFHGIDTGTVNIIKMREELGRLTFEMARLKSENPKNFDKILIMESSIESVKRAIEQTEKLLVARKKLQETEKLSERGRDITKQFRKPIEVYKDAVTELTTLLDRGFINQETFNSAVDEARKKFDDATKSIHKTRESIQMLNAVKFGGPEAEQRFNQYRDLINGQLEDMKRQQEQASELSKLSFRTTPKDAEEILPIKQIGESLQSSIENAINNALRQSAGDIRGFLDDIGIRFKQEQMNLQPKMFKLDFPFDPLLSKNKENLDFSFFPTPVYKPELPKSAPRQLPFIPQEIPHHGAIQFPQREFYEIKTPKIQFPKIDRSIIDINTPDTDAIPLRDNISVSAQAQADNTITQDRQLMIKILQSMDESLDVIKDKPTSVLGVASITS